MASVHRKAGRPHWFAAYREADGKRVFRSTKTGDRRQALEICRAWEKAANLRRVDRLTPERARDIIAEGVASVFSSTGETLPSSTVSAWAKNWLATKELEISLATHDRYRVIINDFLNGLDGKQHRDLSVIRATDVQAFRDRRVRELSRSSANLGVKTVRMLFGAALKQGLITFNPATAVDTIKSRGESVRRPFTRDELNRLLRVADPEWKGLILFGLYTGQRLGDLVRLNWQMINMVSGELSLVAKKTGRRMNLPLAQPLLEYLAGLPSADDLNTPIFPKAFAIAEKQLATVSSEFHHLLVEAGLAQPRTHQAVGRGRNMRRQVSELSFHSLRHNATTMLKSAGVSDAIARAIIGHQSEAISRRYTHFDVDTMREAIGRLPTFE